MRYLLTTKLFCGKCGTLMGGESGTSHMGKHLLLLQVRQRQTPRQGALRPESHPQGAAGTVRGDTAIKVIFSDEIIERLIDLVMEAQQQENTRLPVLKEQLRDTEKRLANLLEAIEQGILTPTTKQRLDELEARKEALNTSILEEELKKPVLTREWIRFWLEKFRKGDVGSTEHQRQIIDTFVNSVYVFDDRVVLISTSRMMPKRSPVRKCWVRVLWTMLHQKEKHCTGMCGAFLLCLPGYAAAKFMLDIAESYGIILSAIAGIVHRLVYQPSKLRRWVRFPLPAPKDLNLERSGSFLFVLHWAVILQTGGGNATIEP